MADCFEIAEEDKALVYGTPEWSSWYQKQLQKTLKTIADPVQLYHCLRDRKVIGNTKLLPLVLSLSEQTIIDVFKRLHGVQLLYLFSEIDSVSERAKLVRFLVSNSYLRTQAWINEFMAKLPLAKLDSRVEIRLGLDRLLEIVRIQGFFFWGWKDVFYSRYDLQLVSDFGGDLSRQILMELFVLPDSFSLFNEHIKYLAYEPLPQHLNGRYFRHARKAILNSTKRASNLQGTTIHEVLHASDELPGVAELRKKVFVEVVRSGDKSNRQVWLDQILAIPDGWKSINGQVIFSEDFKADVLTFFNAQIDYVLANLDSVKSEDDIKKLFSSSTIRYYQTLYPKWKDEFDANCKIWNILRTSIMPIRKSREHVESLLHEGSFHLWIFPRYYRVEVDYLRRNNQIVFEGLSTQYTPSEFWAFIAEVIFEEFVSKHGKKKSGFGVENPTSKHFDYNALSPQALRGFHPEVQATILRYATKAEEH